MSRQTHSLLLTAALLLSGCAYGYAGQEGQRREEPEQKTNTRVVEVREGPDPNEEQEEEGGDQDATAFEESTQAESPCGVRVFDIFHYSGSTQVKKTVDCLDRAITDVQRTPMKEASYVDARAAGLPEDTWYILVDPKGVRADYLNNAQLLRLSRQFEIEYFGRDASRDLLVYLYQDDVK